MDCGIVSVFNCDDDGNGKAALFFGLCVCGAGSLVLGLDWTFGCQTESSRLFRFGSGQFAHYLGFCGFNPCQSIRLKQLACLSTQTTAFVEHAIAARRVFDDGLLFLGGTTHRRCLIGGAAVYRARVEHVTGSLFIERAHEPQRCDVDFDHRRGRGLVLEYFSPLKLDWHCLWLAVWLQLRVFWGFGQKSTE